MTGLCVMTCQACSEQTNLAGEAGCFLTDFPLVLTVLHHFPQVQQELDVREQVVKSALEVSVGIFD